MNNTIVKEICLQNFNQPPDEIERFQVGHGNYVYRLCFGNEIFVLRINTNSSAYQDTINWLEKLANLALPVPKVIYKGIYNNLSYLVLNYIDGDDLGNVYVDLSDDQKQEIAKRIVHIQKTRMEGI